MNAYSAALCHLVYQRTKLQPKYMQKLHFKSLKSFTRFIYFVIMQ